jgi:hypothetical protein
LHQTHLLAFVGLLWNFLFAFRCIDGIENQAVKQIAKEKVSETNSLFPIFDIVSTRNTKKAFKHEK